MARIVQCTHASIFVRNQDRAKEFYGRTLGLKVREHWPKWCYLSMGVSKDGADAGVMLWESKHWGNTGAEAKKMVGVITGIGFPTNSVDRVEQRLRRAGVKVHGSDEGGWPFLKAWDPDGNVIFVTQGKPKRSAPAGALNRLGFVTVASRKAGRLGPFFKNLGMRKRTMGGMAWFELSPKGTAIMPFTVTKSVYGSAKDYEADLAAVGEDTNDVVATPDLPALGQQLRRRKVKFRSGTTDADWGGKEATILDPDGNSYQLIEPLR